MKKSWIHKKNKKRFWITASFLGRIFLAAALVAVFATGCKRQEGDASGDGEKTSLSGEKNEDNKKETGNRQASPTSGPVTAANAGEEPVKNAEGQTEEESKEEKKIIVIDAGHQRQGNYEEEPIGPGAQETKPKVASGTSGTVTGVDEYELNLAVSLKLQKELESRGYQVVMVRTDNDVNMSNAERAKVANDAGADAFLRIHANSDDNSSAQGAMTISPTPNNPYCGQIYQESRDLSEKVLDGLCEAAGAKKRSVWETDTMSGINWCQVPVTIVEMGFMSNPEEDRLLNTEDYQDKIVEGISNGVDNFCKNK